MELLKYSDWKDTQQTLHMIAQMMGKVKLSRMPAQPEWNHVVLYLTAQGFTTGLIPNGAKSFEISLNIETSMVYAHNTAAEIAGFPLRNNTSVSEYYGDFNKMLAGIGCSTEINPVPQEVATTVPFPEQTEKRDYDCESATTYFDTAVFAYGALLEFAAPFRGKKILPSLFWGTFDVTTVLFSGKDAPFPGEGIIGEVAFDEQFVEFGFWPGDGNVDEPSLFIMPYPFVTQDLSNEPIRPQGAFFSMDKKEFFLPIKEIIRSADPAAAVGDFCRSAFDIATKTQGWDCVEWFTRPLLVE